MSYFRQPSFCDVGREDCAYPACDCEQRANAPTPSPERPRTLPQRQAAPLTSNPLALALSRFQRGETKPEAWLRELQETPGLMDWVKAHLSATRPMPDETWKPPIRRAQPLEKAA